VILIHVIALGRRAPTAPILPVHPEEDWEAVTKALLMPFATIRAANSFNTDNPVDAYLIGAVRAEGMRAA
jgi:hypothetical protein